MTTMARARQVVAAALAVAALAALVLLSRVAWHGAGPDVAELRLSWRIPAPSYRQCRPPTEAELRGVLEHMRPSEVCTDTAIPFRLTVRLNGDTLHSEPVTGSGRRARTITILRSFTVPAGSHALDVAFLPELPPGVERGAGEGAVQGTAVDSLDSPGVMGMTLGTRVSAGPGEVVLVSPNENGQLMVIEPGATAVDPGAAAVDPGAAAVEPP